MKTRIVYPRLWFDEKFATISKEAKLLFLYIVTNDQCGLTRYLHVTDRQILFDTGLSSVELRTAKKELEAMNWVFFTDNWAYHAHDAAYVDYEGRDRVLQAKESETSKVPYKIVEYFNGLITRYKPILNHKSKTINQKPETQNPKLVENGLEKLKAKRRELGL